MTDEREGFVVLFPENFPDWALSAEERKAKRRLRVLEDPDDGGDEEQNGD
jgi:hypothetical protein